MENGKSRQGLDMGRKDKDATACCVPSGMQEAGCGEETMKTIKQLFFIILLCITYNTAGMSQNLDTMSVAKRDSLLISMAKEVVLKYGPDYYREDFPPVIERHSVPPKGEINKTGEMAGRVYYHIIFLYDETKEQLSYPFAARVQVWADTGEPSSAFFGNGWGRIISDIKDWRTDTTIEPVRYQQRQVIPIYDWNDSNPDKKILNLDELKRKGYVEQSDGQWVKTTPDVPPSRRSGIDN